MIFKLAFLNLFRHRTRSLLSLLTIAGAVASILIFRGYSHSLLDTVRVFCVDNQYGHLQIGSKKLWNPEGTRVKDQLFELSNPLRTKIEGLPNLASASPRLSLQGLASFGDSQFGAKLIGYDPVLEKEFPETLRLTEGQHLSDASQREIILGQGLQQRLKVKVGDTVSIVAQTVDGVVNAADLTVRGVFQTAVTEIDNQVAFVPISVAQTLLDTSRVEVWILRLKNYKDAEHTRELLQPDLSTLQPDAAIKVWRELADLYNKTESFFDVQNALIQAILAVLTVLAILNTVGMTVYERTGEIGTLRSMGVQREEIISQFLLEGMYLAIFGSILGFFLGAIGITVINWADIKVLMPGATVPIPIRIDYVFSAFCVAALTGGVATLIGTFVPAYRASRLPIVDSLRRNI